MKDKFATFDESISKRALQHEIKEIAAHDFSKRIQDCKDSSQVIRGTREVKSTTKKGNSVSALAQYFRTGEESNLNMEVPSVSGRLHSEQKRVPIKENELTGSLF